MRKFLTTAVIAFGTIITLATAHADPNISWGVTISSGMPPPPVVRYEPLPAPRPSHVWVQGYWNWNGSAHVWVPGHWIAQRRGHVYAQPQWIEGPQGWQLQRGGWKQGAGPGHCPPGQRKKGNC